MEIFIGRKAELQRLRDLKKKQTASMVVIRGRRRVGKSRLVKEFGQEFTQFYRFIGLAPTKKTTAKSEREEFCRQMSRQFGIPLAVYEDWSDIFWAVGQQVQNGKTLILFDEISWMGTKDPLFMSKIKNLWDELLKNNNELIFVICGSASSWIEKNILSSTGFVGRISLKLTLKELPLNDCNHFWPNNVSAFDKLSILSVTGGIPKYLEEINPHENAEKNINRLCFSAGALLVDEFEHIFNKLFVTNSETYIAILKVLSSGAKTRSQIIDEIDFSAGNRLSNYLKELQLAGFIEADKPWNIQTSKIQTKNAVYRLSDNYMRFYLKYIEPNLDKIEQHELGAGLFRTLPNWPSTMGLQFENLVLRNRTLIWETLGIRTDEIINQGPFNQTHTKKHKGCQIDYLIQTPYDLYLIEVKFSQNPVTQQVIEETQTKIDRLVKPKHLSIRPVLIHVNGITADLEAAHYFAKIINFSNFLS